MICERCGRVKATKEYLETCPPGEDKYLCCGEWDPDQCDEGWFERDPDKLYAVDLRRAGLEIPESIPGCAHVPRGSIRFGVPTITGSSDGDTKSIRGSIPVEFTEPFEWVTINMQLPTKEKP